MREFNQENMSERNFTLLGVSAYRIFCFIEMENVAGVLQQSSPDFCDHILAVRSGLHLTTA